MHLVGEIEKREPYGADLQVAAAGLRASARHGAQYGRQGVVAGAVR